MRSLTRCIAASQLSAYVRAGFSCVGPWRHWSGASGSIVQWWGHGAAPVVAVGGEEIR